MVQILFWRETTNIIPPCMKITCQANLPLPPTRAHTHTHARPSFHPTWLPADHIFIQTNQQRRGGRFKKPCNLGEETAFSCLCSNSNSILQITSHETTIAKAVSIKTLERDGMSGSVEEINRLTPGKILGLFKKNKTQNSIYETSQVLFLFSQVLKGKKTVWFLVLTAVI